MPSAPSAFLVITLVWQYRLWLFRFKGWPWTGFIPRAGCNVCVMIGLGISEIEEADISCHVASGNKSLVAVDE